MSIASHRLSNQRFKPATFMAPAEAVGWLGAVQARFGARAGRQHAFVLRDEWGVLRETASAQKM